MAEDVVAELDRWLAEQWIMSSMWGANPHATDESRSRLMQLRNVTAIIDCAVVERARDEIVALHEALEESVKLQRHYALLLNDYDGGGRILFESGKTWMDRLRALKEKGDE